jgi:hypothetical protein
MLVMKVWGPRQRGVSITYATMVGKVEAKASVTMAPEADQVKICRHQGGPAWGEGWSRWGSA